MISHMIPVAYFGKLTHSLNTCSRYLWSFIFVLASKTIYQTHWYNLKYNVYKYLKNTLDVCTENSNLIKVLSINTIALDLNIKI